LGSACTHRLRLNRRASGSLFDSCVSRKHGFPPSLPVVGGGSFGRKLRRLAHAWISVPSTVKCSSLNNPRPLSVLREHRHVPHLIVRIQAHEPAVQQVELDLFHQLPLTADRIQHHQQKRSQQPFRRNRRPSPPRVQRIKMQRQLLQRTLQQPPNPPQRMIRRYPLLRVEVAEHHFLPRVVSSHASFIPHRRVQKRIFPASPRSFFRKL